MAIIPDQSQVLSEKRAVTRAAGVVGFWTVLSRILGFVRDMVIALFMGAGMGADAFFVAFKIPNLLRRLSGEGALTAAFVPTYVDTLQKQGISEAQRLARSTFTITSLILVGITLLGIALSPWIVRIIAPGFFEVAEKFDLTVSLNRIMFPYIFFISLVALASGVLNAMGYFAAPAAAPVVLNLCMIGSLALLGSLFGMEPYYALAWGVIAAGIGQLILQLPFMTKAGIHLRPSFDFQIPALKTIGKLFVPAAAIGGVYQLNVTIGTILASYLASGSVSWLYYADRLVELPLGIFAIALGTAVFPTMSRQTSNGDLRALGESTSYALRLIAFFIVPASVGLIILAEPIVACLFQRGEFTRVDTLQTAYALTCYTAGLWAFSALKVVNQGFFALKDTKTPMWISVIAVAINLVAGLLLMGPMRHGGLALATSIAAACNVLILFVILVRRLGGFPLKNLLVSLGRILVASLWMGVFLLYVRIYGNWEHALTSKNLLVLAICVIGGLAVFLLSAYLLRCRELHAMLQLLKSKRH